MGTFVDYHWNPCKDGLSFRFPKGLCELCNILALVKITPILFFESNKMRRKIM